MKNLEREEISITLHHPQMINIKLLSMLLSMFSLLTSTATVMDIDQYRENEKTNKELLLNYQMTIRDSSDKCSAMNSWK